MKKNLLLIMLCIPVVLAAQNGVTVSGLAVDAGTVTFNVSWDKNNPDMPPLWSDSVWVFVDYNDAGVMKRLPVTDATVSAGTVTKVPNNDRGVWVIGNARTNDSFSAKVELFTEIKDVAGVCAYASNYPPVGKYMSASNISFTGAPDYKVILERIDKSTYTATVGKDESLLMPSGETILSFTDKTGAPGTFACIHSTVYDLKVSASGFCTGDAGVTFALSGTEYGRHYELYRDGTPMAVATLTGTGSAATFTGSMAEGLYTAKVWVAAGCNETVMNGSPVISRNSLPAAPVIAKPASVCLNVGNIVFTANYSGSLEWVSSGGGVVNDNTVTFAGTATGTKTVTARSAQTHTNAPTCYSTEVTQSAAVNALPARPTGASTNSRCDSGTVTFSASVPSGYTIDWYTSSTGTARVSGGGSVTSISPSLTATTTYHAQARNSTTGCVSTTRLAVTGTVKPVPTITRVSTSGAASQSVYWYAPITAIVYTTTNSATISGTGAAYSVEIKGAPSGTPTGTSYTISGSPSATGTFGYSLTASVNGCTSTATMGTITATRQATIFASSKTWSISGRTWSDKVHMYAAACSHVTQLSWIQSENGARQSARPVGTSTGTMYYNLPCARTLCVPPWRLPTVADVEKIWAEQSDTFLFSIWGAEGFLSPNGKLLNPPTRIWTDRCDAIDGTCLDLTWNPTYLGLSWNWPYFGMSVRCVK
jgi:hypothetical protein